MKKSYILRIAAQKNSDILKFLRFVFVIQPKKNRFQVPTRKKHFCQFLSDKILRLMFNIDEFFLEFVAYSEKKHKYFKICFGGVFG